MFFTNFIDQILETIFDTVNIKDLPPVPGTEDKMIVDERDRSLGMSVDIIHRYIISCVDVNVNYIYIQFILLSFKQKSSGYHPHG